MPGWTIRAPRKAELIDKGEVMPAGNFPYKRCSYIGCMIADEIKLTYIGGPTALFEIAGLRFLTDPTFDPKDSEYRTNVYTLHKLKAPAITPDKLGRIDFVLLSHDHHFDNLDNAGRKLLSEVTAVYTTTAGAGRLSGNAVGIEHWQT